MLGHSLCLGRTGNALGVMRVAASLAITFLTPAFLLAAPQLPDPRPDARIEALKKKYDDELRQTDSPRRVDLRQANAQRMIELRSEAFRVLDLISQLEDLPTRPPSAEVTAKAQELRDLIKSNPRYQDRYDIHMYDQERSRRKAKP